MRSALLARLRAVKKFAVNVFPSLAGATFMGIGDSHTQFGNFYRGIGSSLVRDAAGVVTGTVSSNTFYGTPNTAPVNMSDTSFEVLGRNNYNATSTLGTTAGGTNTVAQYTGNTSAATATALTNAAMIDMERFTWRGLGAHVVSAFNGGLEFLGQLGHGGLSAPFTSQITYAAIVNPDILFYLGGTNNAKGGASGATCFAAVKQDLDQIRALRSGAGIPCVVLACPPLGNGSTTGWAAININGIGDPNSPALGFTGGTNTTSLNYLLKQECAAHPTQLMFVDIFTPTCDASAPSAPQLYSNMTTDLTHMLTNAWFVIRTAVQTALAPYITAPSMTSVQAADVGKVANAHTCVAARGPWVTTTGGNFTTGGSGTLPPGWTAGRQGVTTGTVVCSLVDPGGGAPIKVHCVVSSATAGDGATVYPYGSSGSSLATCGIPSATDNAEYFFTCRVTWSGGNAYGLALLQLQAASNGSVYALATDGENTSAEAPGVWPDSGSMILRTGYIQASNSAFTAVVLTLNVFSQTNVSSMALDISEVTVWKK